MDNREAFEIVKKHLLCQGKKSQSLNGYCKYRGEGGLKCAIGALIPDDKYKECYDRDTGLLEILDQCGLGNLNYMMVSELRVIHDSLEIKEWPEALTRVSRKYDLT